MMRHMKKIPIALIAAMAFAALIIALRTGVFTAAPASQAAAAPNAAAAAHLATIKEYCSGCHNDRAKTANLSFDGLTAANIGERAEVFEKAVHKLRGRVMPPPGAKQPDGKTVESLVAWLEESLDRAESPAHIP